MSLQPPYQEVFKSLPGVYLILANDFTVLDVSDAYRKLTPVLADGIIGKPVFSIYENKVNADDFENLRNSLQQSRELNVRDEIEIRVQSPHPLIKLKNTDFIFKIIHVPVTITNQYLLHAINDVTDFYHVKKIKNQQNKLTESLITQSTVMEEEIYQHIKNLQKKNEELTQMNEHLSRLEATKSRLASIVEFSEEAIVTTSLDGTIESWNEGAEKLYGYFDHEIIGKSVMLLFPENKLEEYLQSQEKIHQDKAIHYFDTQRKHKDGNLVSVAISVSPIRNAEQEIIGACIMARDISEYKAARILEQRNKELMEISNLKSNFIANVSHELRTPLHGILGFGRLLQEKSESLTEKQREFIEHILSSGRHLSSLINDVLDLTKIESGKMELDVEKINLPELFQETKSFFEPSLKQKNIHFTTQCDETLEVISTDAKKLKQIIYNYLSNAIKFTPDNGYVTLKAEHKSNNQFCLTVTDTGIGISPDNINKLFVEFQQLDDSTTKGYQGTGLGLAIVRKIALLLGGEVGVSSKLGEGSAFFVILPCEI